ncbi:MAG TPA: MGMT family protein, partial [Thermomicrobiales bacterium]|nr:MGMT family protein [Thermomicrobiales bacterium]
MRQSGLFDDGAGPERARRLDEDPSFPSRVYRLVLLIPPGKVTTYGTIAAVLGDRRGARMVGWAMSSCPPEVSEVAHRVVNRYG